MSWNHRIVKKKSTDAMIAMGEEEYWYGIHEVYYDRKTKKPNMCTVDAISVTGVNLEELKETLRHMLDCLDNPVLDYDLDFPEQDNDALTEEELVELSLDEDETDDFEPTGC